MIDKLMNKNFIKKNKLYFFFVLLIIFSCTWNIDKAIMPYCVSDEIGYWTAAAWFNNFDWSPLMSHSKYYGWGYGVLLSIIFRISDPILRFRMAIIINTLLIILTFILLNNICNKFFSDSNKDVNIFIAGMASCYSYNIIFAHTSMSEIFLTFLFVLSIFTFIRYIEKPCLFRLLLFYIVILFEFATHLRTIVCIIAVFLTFTYMFLERNLTIKKLFIMLFCCFAIIIVVYAIKDLLVKSEYTSSYVSQRLTGNEGILSHLSIFKLAVSLEFWKQLLQSLGGKIYYLICSTAFTIIGAFFYIINNIKKHFIAKHTKQKNEENYIAVKLYIFLCFLGALAVDTICTVFPYRIDTIFYGRYVENMLPVIICMGSYWIMKVCNRKKVILLTILLFSFLGKTTLIYLHNLQIGGSIQLNVSWFSGWLTNDKLYNYFYYTVYPMFISCGLSLLFILLMRKKPKLACLIITMGWLISAETGWLNVVNPQLNRMNDIIDASRELKRMEEPYYCVIPESLSTNGEEFVDVNWLQYQIGTSTLYEITAADIVSKTNNDLHIIISPLNENYDLYTQSGEVIWSNDRFSIVEY